MPAAAALFDGEVQGTLCYLFTGLWSHSDGMYMQSFAAFVYWCTAAARLEGGQTLHFDQLPQDCFSVLGSWRGAHRRLLTLDSSQEAKYLGQNKAFAYTPMPSSTKHANTE